MRQAARAILCTLALLALGACDTQEPLTEADKALFVRVGDLADFGVRYADAASRETFSKAKLSDGAHELVYKFETASGEPRPLHMQVNAILGRKASEAVLADAADKVAMLGILKKAGVEGRDVPGVNSGRLVLLVKGDQPVGNVFSWQDGTRTYLFVMSGLFVRDAKVWQKLIAPKLEQLTRYETKT
jgi:hypothetical protein